MKPTVLLSKAVVRIAEQLGLSQARVADVLGVSPSTASRLFSRDYTLSPEGQEWECGVLLVHLYRSLDTLVGGNTEDARQWLEGQNSALSGQRPIDMIVTKEGLVSVVNYLNTRLFPPT